MTPRKSTPQKPAIKKAVKKSAPRKVSQKPAAPSVAIEIVNLPGNGSRKVSGKILAEPYLKDIYGDPAGRWGGMADGFSRSGIGWYAMTADTEILDWSRNPDQASRTRYLPARAYLKPDPERPVFRYLPPALISTLKLLDAALGEFPEYLRGHVALVIDAALEEVIRDRMLRRTGRAQEKLAQEPASKKQSRKRAA